MKISKKLLQTLKIYKKKLKIYKENLQKNWKFTTKLFSQKDKNAEKMKICNKKNWKLQKNMKIYKENK